MAALRRKSTGEQTIAFPSLEQDENSASSPSSEGVLAAVIPDLVRRGTMRLLQAEIPRGMAGVTAQTWAKAPTLSEVRQGAYTTEGEERWRQFENVDTPSDFHTRRATRARAETRTSQDSKRPEATPMASLNPDGSRPNAEPEKDALTTITRVETPSLVPKIYATDNNMPGRDLTHSNTIHDLQRTQTGTYPNGYKFPPKHTWTQAATIGLHAFLTFTFTSPFGFLATLYALNVIGWGGMIFLLLCGAADPRMCFLQRPTASGPGPWLKDCNDKHTPKSLWIEIDAQVLTALFCVTAFGLAPWRCRDLWHVLQYRVWHEHLALRKLAGAHKGWFRLPGSQHVDPLAEATDIVDEGADAQALVPYPLANGAPPPLTGVRASPTAVWKMDFVVWLMFANTVFQVVLCGFMWGMNRFDRPAWATALFIVLGMLSAIAAGVVQFVEGRKIKRREGVPVEG